jgi:TonB family protein
MKLYLCLIASLIIHFIIVFPWGYAVKKSDVAEHGLVVHAYAASPINELKQEKLELKNQLGFIKHTKDVVKTSHKIQTESSAINNMENEKQITHRLILKMLHDQIAKNQVYPVSALELNQSGTVTIRFILSSNGIIHDALLIKSSGFTSLDLAALNAVSAVSALQNVRGFLKDEEVFVIDVMYR